MADINVDQLDQLGPVDYMVVGFPADKANFSGAMVDELIIGLLTLALIAILLIFFRDQVAAILAWITGLIG